jgi:DNA-binding NarL/FixJ family response regulator
MPCAALIVDGHLGNRAPGRGAVARCGFTQVVNEAADGESGVRVARDLSPDVVLLDVELPDITLAAVLDGNGR